MKILIVYGTEDGQTAKICRLLEKEALVKSYDVTLVNSVESQPDPSDYNAVIIAASMHLGRYQKSIKQYLNRFNTRLNNVYGIFISVSLTAAGKDEASRNELKSKTEQFLLECGWRPSRIIYIAGALLYTRYGFITRFIMKRISQKSGGDTDTSRDFEYTDWDQVRNIIREIEDYEQVTNK